MSYTPNQTSRAPINHREIYDRIGNLLDRVEPYVFHHMVREVQREMISLRDDIRQVLSLQQHKMPNWKKMDKPILGIDFDGVISEYRKGWEGPTIINENPVPGAFHFITHAIQHFTVYIFSSRCNDPAGITAMIGWFLSHGMPSSIVMQLHFEPGKPSWFVHIDDRAIQFDGYWDHIGDPKMLKEEFKPWYYSVPGWREAQAASFPSQNENDTAEGARGEAAQDFAKEA